MTKKAFSINSEMFLLIIGGLVLLALIVVSLTPVGQRFWSFLTTGYDTTDIKEIKGDCDTACFGESEKGFCCKERLANFGKGKEMRK